jgi:hypothetical protein
MRAEGLITRENAIFDCRWRVRPMQRLIFTPSSMPTAPTPGPLLAFIERAQLALVYAREG